MKNDKNLIVGLILFVGLSFIGLGNNLSPNQKSSSNSDSPQLDSVITYTGNPCWSKRNITKFSYDEKNNLSVKCYSFLNLDKNDWEDISQDLYTYDANDFLISDVNQLWDETNTKWNNASKKEYENDLNGNQTKMLTLEWDPVTSKWDTSISTALVEYIYNSDGNRTEAILYMYIAGIPFFPKTRYTYDYDENNNNKEILTYNRVGESWNLANKKVFTYDTDNNKLSDTSFYYESDNFIYSSYSTYNLAGLETITTNKYYWDDILKEWYHVSKSDVTYNNEGKNAEINDYSWSSVLNDWKVESKRYMELRNGKEFSIKKEIWTELDSAWIGQTKTLLSYNINDDIIDKITYKWNFSTWINDSREVHFYRNVPVYINDECGPCIKTIDFKTCTLVNIENNFILNEIKVYPNPAKDRINIKISSSDKSTFNINIYNTIGQSLYHNKIQTGNTEITKTINIDNFQQGIYFINVNNGNDNYSAQLIIK